MEVSKTAARGSIPWSPARPCGAHGWPLWPYLANSALLAAHLPQVSRRTDLLWEADAAILAWIVPTEGLATLKSRDRFDRPPIARGLLCAPAS